MRKQTTTMRKLSMLMLISLLSVQFISAQAWHERNNSHYDKDWSFGLGINAVDDSGNTTKELFKIKDNWNMGNPIYLSAEYHFNNKFSLASNLSFNKYQADKIVDNKPILKDYEASYIAFDLAAKYSFRELLKTHAFDPYVFVGPGFTHIGAYKTTASADLIPAEGRMTANLGLGFNYWLAENWGINMNAAGKYGLGSDFTNQKQYSLGVLYYIPKRKAKDQLGK